MLLLLLLLLVILPVDLLVPDSDCRTNNHHIIIHVSECINGYPTRCHHATILNVNIQCFIVRKDCPDGIQIES